MKKNNSKPASMLLVTGAMLIFLSGCTEALTETGSFTGTLSSTLPKETIGVVLQDEKYHPNNKDVIIEQIVIPAEKEEEINKSDNSKTDEDIPPAINSEVVSKNDIVTPSEIKPIVCPITDIESYSKYLDGLDAKENPLLMLLMPENYSKEELELAAYMQLKNCGLTIFDVQDELHNILVYSQYPRCCSAEEFEMLVGKLHRTLAYSANPFNSYYALSQKVHELTCDLNHTEEYGIYTCDTLKILGEEVRPLTLMEYLDKMMAENYGYQKIKEALTVNPNLYIEDYVVELENLVKAQLIPTSVSEEVWQMLFSKLNATLGEYESLYETYIDLAVYVHNLLYPEDTLTKNELGIYTSRTLKHEMPN